MSLFFSFLYYIDKIINIIVIVKVTQKNESLIWEILRFTIEFNLKYLRNDKC